MNLDFQTLLLGNVNFKGPGNFKITNQQGVVVNKPSVPSSVTATAVSGGTLNTTYYYKVTANNGSSESTGSGEVSAAPSTQAVTVAWSASTNATSYNVYRSTAPGSEVLLVSGITGTSYTDTGAVTPGTATPPSSGAQATTITLPPISREFPNFTLIVDGAGNASTYNITIQGYTQTAWVASTVYAVGATVQNGGNVYQCTSAGTSAGSGGPTGTGTSIVDGTVTWSYTVVALAPLINGQTTFTIAQNYGAAILISDSNTTGSQKNWIAFQFDPTSGGTGVFSAITGSTTPFPITGAAPATATSAGGAVAIKGGIGGATSGAGGATSMTGGAGTAGNAVGGASSVIGGAGQGSAAGGAAILTGGVGGTTGAGGAITLTGGVGGATSGTGGGVTIASGAAGATTGVGGAIAITAGASTNGAGASITLTAAAGATGTSAGGNVNLVPGAAVSTGTPGEVQINGTSGFFAAVWQQDLPASVPVTANSYTFFLANRAYRVKAVSVVCSSSSTTPTVDVTQDTGTGAPGSGTSVLTGAVTFSATANTVVAGTVGTVANATIASGSRLATKWGGTVGSITGAIVSVLLEPV